MFSLPPSVQIFLAAGATDMRKSFNGLEAAARKVIRRDPLSGHLFVFCNRRRNRLKILLFDGTGYWVLAKRLEKGTFLWPSEQDGSQRVEMRADELMLLLAGIDLTQSQDRAWFRRPQGRRAG